MKPRRERSFPDTFTSPWADLLETSPIVDAEGRLRGVRTLLSIQIAT